MFKGADITDWYQSLDPEVRHAAVRGLIGSALGAGTLGGVSAATSIGTHKPRRVINNAMMGALLGGVGAAGVPAGLNMIRGKTRFPGEHNKPLIGRGIDMIGQPFTTHPATTVGMAGGLYFASKGSPMLGEALSRARRKVKLQDERASTVGKRVDVGGKFKPGVLSLEQAAAKPTRVSQNLRALASMFLSPRKALKRTPSIRKILPVLEKGVEPNAANLSLAENTIGKGVRGLYALPIGLGAGWLLDRYLKGNY